jgi:PII-like signaling protein
MTTSAAVLRLVVIVDEDRAFRHQPLYQEIVRRARAAGLAGASVFRGIEGFGSSGTLHTNRILNLTAKLPAMVLIVDREDAVRAFLPQLDELDVRGVVTLDEVEVVRPGRIPAAVQ